MWLKKDGSAVRPCGEDNCNFIGVPFVSHARRLRLTGANMSASMLVISRG